MIPKISVIVPIYNAEHYLKKCINSILAQTLSDFELILVNDGSRDRSGQICDKYAQKDKRIRVIHQQNGGVSSARNTGLRHALGEYIRYCDADDWFAPEMLEQMYQAAIINQADVITCDFCMVYNDKQVRYRGIDWNQNKTESLQNYIASTWTSVSMMLVRHTLFTKYQLQSPIGISYCEDFHLAVRICFYAQKIVAIHEPFYFYNQMNINSTMYAMNNGRNSQKTMKEEIAVYSDIISFFKELHEYNNYEKVMSWRILKAKQDWVLHRDTWNEFINLVPESKKYIFSCPYLNIKMKWMTWCLTHHLTCITALIIKMREIAGR